jgi:hypothetical protein
MTETTADSQDWEAKWKALELEVRRALCVLMIEEPDLEDAIDILVDALVSEKPVTIEHEK